MKMKLSESTYELQTKTLHIIPLEQNWCFNYRYIGTSIFFENNTKQKNDLFNSVLAQERARALSLKHSNNQPVASRLLKKISTSNLNVDSKVFMFT